MADNNVQLARVVFLVTFLMIGCNYQCSCFGLPRFQSVPTTVKTFENNTVTLPCVYAGALILLKLIEMFLYWIVLFLRNR